MSGLYDRLNDQLGKDDDNQPAGLTPLDIADLPDGQRQVMFALLRDSRSSGDGVSADVLREKLPQVEGLAAVLDELTRNSWLIRLGEAPNVRYKVEFPPQARKLTRRRDMVVAEQPSGGEARESGPGTADLPSLSDW